MAVLQMDNMDVTMNIDENVREETETEIYSDFGGVIIEK